MPKFKCTVDYFKRVNGSPYGCLLAQRIEVFSVLEILQEIFPCQDSHVSIYVSESIVRQLVSNHFANACLFAMNCEQFFDAQSKFAKGNRVV